MNRLITVICEGISSKTTHVISLGGLLKVDDVPDGGQILSRKNELWRRGEKIKGVHQA